MERDVDAGEDGGRADVVLAAWLGEPRARAQQRLAAAQVRVGGEVIGKSRRLRAGERVSVAPPAPRPPPPPPPPVPLRHDDEHLAVVAKPAGLVVHAGAGTRPGGSLVDALRAQGVPLVRGEDGRRPGIVHRLDRGTSGLLVVAKTDRALHGLLALFRRHDVDRRYWALVDGVPEPARATIAAAVARSTAHRTRFRVDPGGRPAVSHYDLVEEHGRASVVEVRLETGRTHQVRVHMAAVGHPVCGDLAYGAAPAVRADLGLDRPALHAAHLGFDHPITGQRIDLDEPLPADLQRALARLRSR